VKLPELPKLVIARVENQWQFPGRLKVSCGFGSFGGYGDDGNYILRKTAVTRENRLA
jgi:hypothetical protein